MADYRLVLDGLAVFVVDIAPTSGRRSIRRFPTEPEALAWIAQQEFRDAATGPRPTAVHYPPHAHDPFASID